MKNKRVRQSLYDIGLSGVANIPPTKKSNKFGKCIRRWEKRIGNFPKNFPTFGFVTIKPTASLVADSLITLENTNTPVKRGKYPISFPKPRPCGGEYKVANSSELNDVEGP